MLHENKPTFLRLVFNVPTSSPEYSRLSVMSCDDSSIDFFFFHKYTDHLYNAGSNCSSISGRDKLQTHHTYENSQDLLNTLVL